MGPRLEVAKSDMRVGTSHSSHFCLLTLFTFKKIMYFLATTHSQREEGLIRIKTREGMIPVSFENEQLAEQFIKLREIGSFANYVNAIGIDEAWLTSMLPNKSPDTLMLYFSSPESIINYLNSGGKDTSELIKPFQLSRLGL